MRAAFIAAVLLISLAGVDSARADSPEENARTEVGNTSDAVRVVILRLGGSEQVREVSGGGATTSTCQWDAIPAEFAGLGDVITVPSEQVPGSLAVLYALFCDGNFFGAVWVAPEDVVDLDALVAAEAQRYVEDVLAPDISIGVNPSVRGLVGLPSWFWVEGFGGSITATPIQALGMTVEVRMASGSVTWDFGDGTVVEGDLGQAYPDESSVQHVHQDAGEYAVSAQIDLVPEYRVNGGPWLTLPELTVSAQTDLAVDERQAVITNR